MDDPESDWLEAVRTSAVADDLPLVSFAPGARLLDQGNAGHRFLIVADGHAVVRQDSADGPTEIARVGPGALLGELSLFTGSPRSNTVTAIGEVQAFSGDEQAFARLLELEPVRRHFALTAAERLAGQAKPVTTTLRSGMPVLVRPLLPQDRSAYLDALGRVSQETLRKRFFTAGQPPASVIEYLLDVDYARHFAWVVVDPANDEHPGIAIARYICATDSPPDQADLAFGIADEFQSQGLGTMLFGALGVAARANGFERLGGEVLADNLAMRAVFEKAGAEWTTDEPGVVRTTVAVERAAALIDPDLADRLEASIHHMAVAASIALT